eukprot:1783517-Pyramimonas_sp.AAC.1
MRFGGHQKKAAPAGIGIRSAVDGHTAMDRHITVEHLMGRYNTFEWSEHMLRERSDDMVMTCRVLLRMIKGPQTGKAPGPDDVTMDLLRVAPEHGVDLLLLLYTKINVSSREPLRFKGGWQADLF